MKTAEKLAKLKKRLNKLVIPFLTFNVKKGMNHIATGTELERHFTFLAEKKLSGVTPASSAKSTEDVGIRVEGLKNDIKIDVKTTDIDKDFNMPNLISIDKLQKNYDKDIIMYVMMSYSSKQHKIIGCKLFYIWELPWEHLGMGGLGLGQLQIKNMKVFLNDIKNFKKITKKKWYKELIIEGHKFYEKTENKMKMRKNDWLKKKEKLLKYGNKR